MPAGSAGIERGPIGFTWTLTFLDAAVRDNPATQEQLLTMASVAGGGDDSVVIFYNGPP